MKIKFLATSKSYQCEIENESINGFDLSEIEEGDKFIGNQQTRELGIRDAYRQDGELHAILCQAVPVSSVFTAPNGNEIPIQGGNWTESDWIDANEYDPETLYIQEVGNGLD